MLRPLEHGSPSRYPLSRCQRNVDQQQFLLSIFLSLQARVDEQPDDFADLPLTVLSEVAQNGVHTISSVRSGGIYRCSEAAARCLGC